VHVALNHCEVRGRQSLGERDHEGSLFHAA
jgi:hypothetical protein